jgi:hypothetical protein
MFYVNSYYTGDSEHVDTEEEAITLAKQMLSDDQDQSKIEIYKLHKTVEVKTNITYDIKEV